MKKQKKCWVKEIPTNIGIAVVAIIAIIVGIFLWQHMKSAGQSISQVPNTTIPKKQPQGAQVPSLDWQAYQNDTYNFKLEYPSNYTYKENLAGDSEYSISLMPAHKEAPDKSSGTGGNFDLIISKNEAGLNSFIKKQINTGAAVEQKLEVVDTEDMTGVPARVIKACDIANNCDKIIDLLKGKYIYSIYMQGYFSSNDQVDKEILSRMFASFEFLQK